MPIFDPDSEGYWTQEDVRHYEYWNLRARDIKQDIQSLEFVVEILESIAENPDASIPPDKRDPDRRLARLEKAVDALSDAVDYVAAMFDYYD